MSTTTAVALNPAIWYDVMAMGAVLSPDRRLTMASGLLDALKKIAISGAGIGEFPAPLMAVVVMALLHQTTGSGLYLDDAIWDGWCAWNGSDVTECSGCGARFPPGWRTCAACGSVTGEPGLWTLMRAAGSSVN
jgi:hypothetical protein